MKVHDVVQGSPEWIDLRLGMLTASRFDRVLTPAKLLFSSSAEKFACELIGEKVIGEPMDAASSKFMQRGTKLEAEAIAWLEMDQNVDIDKVGFITDDGFTVGGSPDGLIGDDGGAEIKCLSAMKHSHLAYGGTSIVQEYRLQVQGYMWITSREWWYLLAYHPTMPPVLERVERDEDCIAKIASAVDRFNDMLQEKKVAA